MDEIEVQRLAIAINALRPDWPIKSLRTFIAGESPRAWGDLAVAVTDRGRRASSPAGRGQPMTLRFQTVAELPAEVDAAGIDPATWGPWRLSAAAAELVCPRYSVDLERCLTSAHAATSGIVRELARWMERLDTTNTGLRLAPGARK